MPPDLPDNPDSTAQKTPAPQVPRVASLDDLAPALARYRCLVADGRGDEALALFRRELAPPLIHPLGAFSLKLELIQELATAGREDAPPFAEPGGRASFLLELGHSYLSANRPGDALAPLTRAVETGRGSVEPVRYTCGLGWLSKARRLTGRLEGATAAGRAAVDLARRLEDRGLEAYGLHFLGLALAARGLDGEADRALERGLRAFEELDAPQEQGVLWTCRAQAALWAGDAEAARAAADQAWRLAAHEEVEDDFIRAGRLAGAAALALGDLETAESRLSEALDRARRTGFLQEETLATVAWAEVQRHRGRLMDAAESLDRVEESAVAGPFRLELSDVAAARARVRRDAGRRAGAVAAARRAYELAWCDGPPAAYRPGLQAAGRVLEELDTEPPAPPPGPLFPGDDLTGSDRSR